MTTPTTIQFDLATCAKAASKRCRFRDGKTKMNSFSVDEILNFVREFRKNENYLSTQEFSSSEDCDFDARYSSEEFQQEAAIKWIFELLRFEDEKLFNQVSDWKLSINRLPTNRDALDSLKTHLLSLKPDSLTAYFRIDRPTDHSSRPRFKSRVLAWTIACLRANLPVLLSYPIRFKASEFSMYETEPYKLRFPNMDESRRLFVPAVAFEKTTNIYKNAGNLNTVSHGIRCRLFLPYGESCVLTVPDYYFFGDVRDCWLIVDPQWGKRLNI